MILLLYWLIILIVNYRILHHFYANTAGPTGRLQSSTSDYSYLDGNPDMTHTYSSLATNAAGITPDTSSTYTNLDSNGQQIGWVEYIYITGYQWCLNTENDFIQHVPLTHSMSLFILTFEHHFNPTVWTVCISFDKWCNNLLYQILQQWINMSYVRSNSVNYMFRTTCVVLREACRTYPR